MGTADPWCDGVAAGSASPSLLQAAVALRWNRPDLTATLAEVALEAATDVDSWVIAAGWLLHGRAALGDGRDTVCDLLDGLDRWGAAGVERLAGTAGRRLRVEMAGPVRRIGEPTVARALLSAEADVDDDLALRADVLTELARCAADDAPDTADDALAAAEQAWRAAACAPGVASVVLLRAARNRRAGRSDVAAAEAADGLGTLQTPGRRAGASDHMAAALTAEWIAALVEAGRVDEARGAALPAANRLIETARPSRQVAGLRLAIARLAAVGDGPELVFDALEPAAQDAAHSDVPELESACRSMLGELHEGAGRLDAALTSVRAAMVAERRDRDRSVRLRARLATATASWAARPSSRSTPSAASYLGSTSLSGGAGGGVAAAEIGPADAGEATGGAPSATAQPALVEPVLGRRARRRAAESPDDPAGGGGRTDGALFTTSRPELVERRGGAASEGWAADPGGLLIGGSLIGDALLRELEGARPAPGDVPPPDRARGPRRVDSGRGIVAPGVDDRVSDPYGVGAPAERERHRHGSAGRANGSDLSSSGSGRRHDVAGSRSPVDPSAEGWHRAAWAEQRPSAADTVVFGVAPERPVDARDRTGGGSYDPRHIGDPRPTDAAHGVGGPVPDGARHGGTVGIGRPGDGDGRPGGWCADGGSSGGASPGSTAARPAEHGRPGDAAARADGAQAGMRAAVGHGHPGAARADRAGRGEPVGRPANGARAHGAHGNGSPVNGAHANGSDTNGAHAGGVHPNGTAGGGEIGGNESGDAGTGARDDAGAGASAGRPDHRAPAGPARRAAGGRGPGRPPSTDADGLGLADLLAGALAAYRDL